MKIYDFQNPARHIVAWVGRPWRWGYRFVSFGRLGAGLDRVFVGPLSIAVYRRGYDEYRTQLPWGGYR